MTLEHSTAESEWPSEQAVEATPATSMQPPELGDSPDNPPWSPLMGIAVWFASVLSIVVVPTVPVLVWMSVKSATDPSVPKEPEAWTRWAEAFLQSPPMMVAQILMTGVAHLITIALCWVVVTHAGKRPFWRTLGWQWNGPSVWSKILYVAGAYILAFLAIGALEKWLPSKKTPFDILLENSQSARVAVAALAILTAPIVEEVVYRGVLYSGLRRRMSAVAVVPLVTFLFAAVHVPQYWGNWSTIVGLMFLSLILTMVRATSRSLQPAFWIHAVFNFISAMAILFAYRNHS